MDSTTAEGLLDVYLDDVRHPPFGWYLVTSIAEVKALLTKHRVRRLSLDHDLGACDRCIREYYDTLQRGDTHKWEGCMPHCSHVGTGYDLVRWMEETGKWPAVRPVVHSMNPDGRRRMEQAIARRYDEGR